MNKVKVKLHIGPVTREFAVPPEKEADFRHAADQVSRAWLKYKNSTPGQDAEALMAIAALDVAVRGEESRREKDTTPYARSIERLTAEIEEVLSL